MFKKLFNNKIIYPFNNNLNLEKIYSYLIISFIFVSLLIEIPSDRSSIGISSVILDIGDRIFYISGYGNDYGYSDYSGNILYPYILKTISFFTGLFGKDQYSKLWNLIIILITSSLSIISLRFLRLATLNIFNQNVSNIASILYIINPYTYFYSLSGGITNFLIMGVSLILYLFSKKTKLVNNNNINSNLCIILLCAYLSFLRPSGGVFGFIILMFLLWEVLKKIIHQQVFGNREVINTVFIILGLTIVTYNISSTLDYSISTAKLFANEGGQFFGYPRDYLRNRLTIQSNSLITNFKNTLYFLMWKITDFVSGLSDVRDTHSAFANKENVLPFMARTFTGIFILFPINLFSFLGIITNLKFILKSQIWIVLLSAFVAICPSLIGVSMSRYLMMFYPPFIVFSAKMIHDTFLGIRESKI